MLHDWADDKAESILQNVILAMGPDSKILIDGMVLPNTGVHWWSACLDHVCDAGHRNVDQWQCLMGKCGLKVPETKTYMPVMIESFFCAVPKEM